MDWQQTTVRELFDGAGALYEVPPYQREYQWKEADLRELWTDIYALYREFRDDGEIRKPHFLGIVLLEVATGPNRRKVIIDGQQRLVTLLLLEAAMLHHEAEREEREFKSNHKLFHPVDDDDNPMGPRISVQVQDRDVLHDTLRGDDGWRTWYASFQKKGRSGSLEPRIQAAYVFFRYLLWLGDTFENLAEHDISLPVYSTGDVNSAKKAEAVWADRLKSVVADPPAPPQAIDLMALWSAIKDHMRVVLLIVGEQDQDAQAIFQSINAKRRPLEQWDLVRNEIFLALPKAARDDLYQGLWHSIEVNLGRSRYDKQRGDSRDLFIYDFLIAEGEHRRQHGIARNRGYLHLRQLRRSRKIIDGSNELLHFVRDELLLAGRLWPVAIGGASVGVDAGSHSAAVRASLETIIRMSAGPMTPVVLHVLLKHARHMIDHGQLAAELRLIEVFVVRQVLVGRSMSPLRSAMVTLMNQLVAGEEAADLKTLLFGGVSKFPPVDDRTIRSNLRSAPLYGKSALLAPSQLGALFRGLERTLSGGAANPLPYGKNPDDFSVEHVFPQAALSKPTAWDSDIRSWRVTKASYKNHVHRLGNLTLLTNKGNKHLRTKAFADKKSFLTSGGASAAGTRAHPLLAISQGLGRFDRWTKGEIDERTDHLIDEILGTWPNP